MSTAPTTQQPASGFTAHALVAIGQHMAAHHLPQPSTILFERDPLEVIVCVGNHDWTEWLTTVLVDEEHNEYRTPKDGVLEPYLASAWQVRLPDTGVKVTVRAFRDLPLRAVSL